MVNLRLQSILASMAKEESSYIMNNEESVQG